jgi:hypothetical protein
MKKISELTDMKMVEKILCASEVEKIKEKDKLSVEMHHPYLYFDAFFMDDTTVQPFWNGRSEFSNQDSNAPAAIAFMKRDPYAIRGPVLYNEIKGIYEYLGGNDWKEHTIKDDEVVFFTVGDTLKKSLLEIFLKNNVDNRK